jgi:hypothetical protein
VTVGAEITPVSFSETCRQQPRQKTRLARSNQVFSSAVNGFTARECLDCVVVFGERHLCHLLKSYQRYYNEARTHLSLSKDAPVSRGVQTVGHILCLPILGGLHHQYVRI